MNPEPSAAREKRIHKYIQALEKARTLRKHGKKYTHKHGFSDKPTDTEIAIMNDRIKHGWSKSKSKSKPGGTHRRRYKESGTTKPRTRSVRNSRRTSKTSRVFV